MVTGMRVVDVGRTEEAGEGLLMDLDFLLEVLNNVLKLTEMIAAQVFI